MGFPTCAPPISFVDSRTQSNRLWSSFSCKFSSRLEEYFFFPATLPTYYSQSMEIFSQSLGRLFTFAIASAAKSITCTEGGPTPSADGYIQFSQTAHNDDRDVMRVKKF